MSNKTITIFGGGTVEHIKNHFAVTAPAYGNTARTLKEMCEDRWNSEYKVMDINLELTKMAGGSILETNDDISKKIYELTQNSLTKVIFFSCALVDYKPTILKENMTKSSIGKYEGRIKTSETFLLDVEFEPTPKLINNIRKFRKDIFLVGFKTTCGATRKEMYLAGLTLCKKSSVNLVLVNDTKTRLNMIITPEEAAYHELTDRNKVLLNLVDMTYYRSHLTFTQSKVVDGESVSWNDATLPANLRTVVNYCINQKAYKTFNGATVGHFAVKISDTEFLTSIRKSNFNDIEKIGLVRVKTDGPDTVLAYGAKPSVGGQSQRAVFKDHPGYDCIVHFHCPIKESPRDKIPIKSQREIECGSHECGKNTSEGLVQFGNLKAVYLDKHGPNIIFSKDTDAKEVIDFIDANFDLSLKTGGYQL